MNVYLEILLITALTGVGGLSLGGMMAAMVHSPTNKTMSLMLRFTAGIMISVVCFDLIQDGAENASMMALLFWITAGYFATYLLNCWVDKQAHHGHAHGGHSHGAPHQHAHDGHEHYHHVHGEQDYMYGDAHHYCHDHGHHHHGDHSHDHHGEHDHSAEHDHPAGDEMCACGSHTLKTAGLVLAAAVALHNMPVGMAIGATFAETAHSHDHSAVLAALIIGLHNLPEGMAIAAPLITGGARKVSAIAITAFSGLPTIIGALLGYSIGTMNALLLGISLSFAAGAMLYVVFGELLPESEHLWQHRLSGVATMLGVLLGLALIGAGHVH